MNSWDMYQNRIVSRGGTKREAARRREIHTIEKKLPDNLSYQTVEIDGVSQNVAIIDTDNLNEKTILSMPGEDIIHGGLVDWMDNHWLVTERDANQTLRTRAKLEQCNYLLKWVGDDNTIHEQWCIIEDGTKYLTGEYEDRNFIVTRGDSRISMTIARNDLTVKFRRDMRFLIDDPESERMMAYLLTKPLKLGHSFNGYGVLKFVLQEVVTTDDDNQELGIADYYKHFPKEGSESNKNQDDTGKKVWI